MNPISEEILRTDEEIMADESLNMSEKRYILCKKYGTTFQEMMEQITIKKARLYYEGNKIFNLTSDKVFNIETIAVENQKLIIEGRTNLSNLVQMFLPSAYDEAANKIYRSKVREMKGYERYAEDGTQIYWSYECRMELPLYDHADYRLILLEKAKKKKRELNYTMNGYYARLHRDWNHGYICEPPYLITYEDGHLRVAEYQDPQELKTAWLQHEDAFAEELRLHDLGDEEILALRREVIRRRSEMTRPLWLRPLWLISDRAYRAGDNGEAFFRYAVTRPEAESHFMVDKNSEDFERMSQIGTVIPYGTREHQLDFLCCDWLISSSADGWVFNLMKEHQEAIKDLIRFRYAFLQHGVIMKDFSSWLHKVKKHIRFFVTSARPEYDAIVNGNYGYTKKDVKLTGMPRFDRLVNQRKRLIIIMPTWRKSIAPPHVPSESNPNIFVRGYSEDFKNTDYFRFYQGLLNDHRFQRLLRWHFYQCIFVLHPSFENQIKDFHSDCRNIHIVSTESVNYSQLFGEASLMVTDYSSVSHDFAYLRKPVIYSQFDPHAFFEEHTGKEGFFSYEDDGFGPVCDTLDSTVEAICQSVRHRCRMEPKYLERCDQFFAFQDQKSSERIYNELLKM